MTITDAFNTYNYALDLLYKEKYEVFTMSKDEEYILYIQKEDDITFAEEPLSLLAITYLRRTISIDKDRIDIFMNDYSALAIKDIIERNCKLSITSDYCPDWYDWIATKNSDMYIAQTPLRLLSLILIVDSYGIDWDRHKIPCYLNNIKDL